MARTKNEFQTIHSEGGLLPPDLLRRVVDPKANLSGTKPEDYGLPQGERINETITQSWNRLRRHWAEFRAAAKNLPEGEAGTGLTNDKWSVPLLRELGFGLLPTTPGPESGGRTYAINRFSGPTAIHLVGCGLSLDRRAAGVRGAAATNPHGLVQEFLNRSPGHLWAIVSNGLRFRVLRDNQALSRQSYLEFDLEAMLTGEVFSDFVLLWLMAHATRFAPQTETRPETCWLEQWTKVADEEGTRALGDLRAGVEQALQILGEAFVSHPRNTALREAFRTGRVPLADFHGQLLRLVYRLIFLFVSEDRTLDGVSLLHPRDESEAGGQARERYDANYSTARMRELAAKIKGSRHGDLWQQFNLLVGALSGDTRFATARQQLALPVLGSFLWSPDSTAALNAGSLSGGEGVELANADFLEALRHLAYTRQGKVLRPVDYKNLGAEELGGVYESLLALTPQISGDGNRFTFAEFAGNERKTSGSYYTPDSLVQCLLDSALDSVVEEALKGKSGTEAEKAILSLKVCDPAVGSGHFLVGAAHRLARHLARVRANAQGESEPSPLLYQHALRDVIARCLYGVDINPMSAELCRVGLWLEALEPGKPLSFLDHHIQVGNSLLGTTPALLAAGIPDDAFTPIEGDIKAKCTELKRENKRERQEYKSGQGYLFEPPIKLGNLASEFAQLSEAPNDTAEAVAETSRRYAELVRGTAYQFGRLLADTWCAAFVWKKDGSDLGNLCPTERAFRKVESHAAAGLLPHVRAEVESLRDQYQFFHWHLAFPDVFRLPNDAELPDNEQCGWSGGFDVVLGNPPWEMPEVDDREFFAGTAPEISTESAAQKRRAMIAGLATTDVPLHEQWLEHVRRHEGERSFFAQSGRFPNAATGRLNYYKLFVELGWCAVAKAGRLGMVVPSVLTTNAYERPLWHSLVKPGFVASVIDFENKEGLFPNVDRRAKFSLLALTRVPCRSFRTGCWLYNVSDIANPERVMPLTLDELIKFSPDELALPQFRSRRDLELLSEATDKLGRLSDHSDWAYTPRLMFSSSDDVFQPVDRRTIECSRLTNLNRRLTSDGISLVPVYEGKMVGILDHRQADIYINPNNPARQAQERPISDAEKADPHRFALPQFWLREDAVRGRRFSKSQGDWELVFCDVTSATNERTALACVIPLSGMTRSLPAIYLDSASAADAALLAAVLSTFAVDFLARLKVSTNHLTQGILATLPIPSCNRIREFAAARFGNPEWFEKRALELSFTAWDLKPFAVDLGYEHSPFRFDATRRQMIQCETDAACFHLYGHGRDDVTYVMQAFPTVERRDNETHGEYRTRRMVLEYFDAMEAAKRSGAAYESGICPQPGTQLAAHPA